MDTLSATSKNPILASPKLTKLKAIVGLSTLPNVQFGCEHVRMLFEKAKRLTRDAYEEAIQVVHEPSSIKAQTFKSPASTEGRPSISLRPTYLCLQCPIIMSAEGRDKHFGEKKHAFSVESRSGYLYCQKCQDFVYDPELEKIRLQRGTKRKFEDLGSSEDQRIVATHSSFVPCRATGLRGFYNMGNTCFMSVILQTLIHNPLIRNYYLAEGHNENNCEKEHCLSCAMDEVFTEFYSAEKTEGYGAVAILMASWMAEQALVGYQQQDAHEYMQFLFNALHSENGGTSSSDCTCIIHQVFYGALQSTITCDKCKNVTTTLDPVMDLSLDIRQIKKQKKLEKAAAAEKEKESGKKDSKDKDEPITVDLKDCLSRFTAKEKLPPDAYTCTKCANTSQPATKQLSIKRLPPCVPIHLKRFSHNVNATSASKLETKISFPLQLDLYPYTTLSKTSTPSPSKKSASSSFVTPAQPTLMYDLAAVIVHKGKIDSGHYVSYSREGNDWFLFDDNKAVTASEAEVLDAQGYLLFYMIRELPNVRREGKEKDGEKKGGEMENGKEAEGEDDD